MSMYLGDTTSIAQDCGFPGAITMEMLQSSDKPMKLTYIT